MAFMFKCESIFDHGVTRLELADSGFETDKEVEDYKQRVSECEEVDFWALCFLFQKRGQTGKVKEYFARAEKEGFPDTFTLGHELAGGCLRKPG